MRLVTALLGLGLISPAAAADLSGVKTYLNGKLDTQLAGTRALSAAADRYYALAKGTNFDYKALAKTPRPAPRCRRPAPGGHRPAPPTRPSRASWPGWTP
ncbi:hypothetical protein ACFP9V_00260 [Deinococcus radiopugnans]|uniref:hypothetical protein n=1 Tax=Deinococcus radiopugnans TaxID=57497 RepID=UPI003613CD45